MSKAWAKGSSKGWRRLRAYILATKGPDCWLATEACTTRATQVHHVVGRAASGDDPKYLVPACRPCNLAVADPTRGRVPHRNVSNW